MSYNTKKLNGKLVLKKRQPKLKVTFWPGQRCKQPWQNRQSRKEEPTIVKLSRNNDYSQTKGNKAFFFESVENSKGRTDNETHMKMMRHKRVGKLDRELKCRICQTRRDFQNKTGKSKSDHDGYRDKLLCLGPNNSSKCWAANWPEK